MLANFRHGFPLKLTLFLLLALPGAGCMGYCNENTPFLHCSKRQVKV